MNGKTHRPFTCDSMFKTPLHNFPSKNKPFAKRLPRGIHSARLPAVWDAVGMRSPNPWVASANISNDSISRIGSKIDLFRKVEAWRISLQN